MTEDFYDKIPLYYVHVNCVIMIINNHNQLVQNKSVCSNVQDQTPISVCSFNLGTLVINCIIIYQNRCHVASVLVQQCAQILIVCIL